MNIINMLEYFKNWNEIFKKVSFFFMPYKN